MIHWRQEREDFHEDKVLKLNPYNIKFGNIEIILNQWYEYKLGSF